jgi:hypothetical protein
LVATGQGKNVATKYALYTNALTCLPIPVASPAWWLSENPATIAIQYCSILPCILKLMALRPNFLTLVRSNGPSLFLVVLAFSFLHANLIATYPSI